MSGATTLSERTAAMANVSIFQSMGFILGPGESLPHNVPALDIILNYFAFSFYSIFWTGVSTVKIFVLAWSLLHSTKGLDLHQENFFPLTQYLST